MGVCERQPSPLLTARPKTLAFEIADQLGWELPDRWVVPVASGSLFTRSPRGFKEWCELGLLQASFRG